MDSLVEHNMKESVKQTRTGVTQDLKLYNKIEDIPPRDILYMSYEKDFTKALFQKEKILLSEWIMMTGGLLGLFAKKKRLIVTSEQIIQCNAKSGEARQQNTYNDLLGITKSLMIGQQNFILHFRDQACIEM